MIGSDHFFPRLKVLLRRNSGLHDSLLEYFRTESDQMQVTATTARTVWLSCRVQSFEDRKWATGYRCPGHRTGSRRPFARCRFPWSCTAPRPNLTARKNPVRSLPEPTSISCFPQRVPFPTTSQVLATPSVGPRQPERLARKSLASACP